MRKLRNKAVQLGGAYVPVLLSSFTLPSEPGWLGCLSAAAVLVGMIGLGLESWNELSWLISAGIAYDRDYWLKETARDISWSYLI